VLIEVGWSADCLAGVVDDEVEAGAGAEELGAEGFDAGGVAEVEAVNLKAVAPFGEVGLGGIALSGVAGEARGDDEFGPGAQEFEAGLVADFDAASGEESDAAVEVGEFRATGEVEVGARGAHLVVEVVDRGELLLADVAVSGLVRFGLGGGLRRRREVVGRCEDGPAAERSDAGLVEDRFVALNFRVRAALLRGFDGDAAGRRIRVVNLGDSAVKALAVFGGHAFEEAAVARYSFQQVGCGAKAVEENGGVRLVLG